MAVLFSGFEEKPAPDAIRGLHPAPQGPGSGPGRAQQETETWLT